jgi:predicted NBD/HSP70 family sugar kinase
MRTGVTPRGPFTSRASAQIFTTLLSQGPLSRVELSRRVGLSAAAVTRAVRPLLDERYVVEEPEGRSRRELAGLRIGRPAMPLRVRADRAAFVGVKITEDEMVAVLTDLRADVQEAVHEGLPSHDVAGAVRLIGDVVGRLRRSLGRNHARLHGLGVSVAGDVDQRGGLVRNSPFLRWRDVPLADLVETATGVPTALDNDVRALTVAEQLFGAGVDASAFALVTVGAGIGCGLVVHDRVVTGFHGVAGELGHLPIDPAGPACSCGNRGCLEAIASDHAILRQVRELTGDPALTQHRCLELARAGHADVRAVYTRAGHAIGLGIATVANLIGPSLIILSGEGLAAYDLFEEQIRQTYAAQAFGSAVDCELLVRPLPFEQWARGAAAVAIQRMVAFGA